MNPAIIGALISAAGSVGGSLLASDPKESGSQKRKRELIDELLSSIGGQGRFSNLFRMDEDAFQKSFIDPAKARFKNQITPQIQQGFIASGQQRGTGLDDTLTRAGVDMDQLLNQYYMDFQQNAMNRQTDMLGNILSSSGGVEPGFSTGEKLSAGAAGYLSGGQEGFGGDLNKIFDAYSDDQKAKAAEEEKAKVKRKGFENDLITRGAVV